MPGILRRSQDGASASGALQCLPDEVPGWFPDYDHQLVLRVAEGEASSLWAEQFAEAGEQQGAGLHPARDVRQRRGQVFHESVFVVIQPGHLRSHILAQRASEHVLVSGQVSAMQRVEKKRFNVEEYHRMAELGVLGAEERVELIEGEIVEIAPVGSRHAACVKKLNSLLNRKVGGSALVSVQDPIRLSELSEPEPDLALLRPREDFYAERHPRPEDVLLVIEVSDTSAEYDAEVKLPLYARAGVPEVWLVDLNRESIEIHHRPATGTYRETLRVARGESFASRTVSGLELAADAVLG
jgi:Uma2 family endonuclease